MSLSTPHTDLLLLRRIAEGDEAAFSQLFHAWKGKLYGFLLDLTHAEAKAEDMVQDIFAKVWQRRGQLEDITNFSAYLFRMAQNHAIDQLRRLSRESAFLASLAGSESPSSSPEDSLLKKEVLSLIQQAIETLPPRQKEIYHLHQQQGLKHEEIAIRLGLSISTVQNHMFRALENIRTYLNAHFPDAAAWLMILTVANFF